MVTLLISSEAILLMISFAIMSIFLIYILREKNKKQIHYVFIAMFSLFIVWILGLIMQIAFGNGSNEIYFDYIIYIPICIIPVLFFIMSLVFANTKIKINRLILCLLIIPIVSIAMLWTNDAHHLFYKHYSINLNQAVYGSYFNVHLVYTYLMYSLGILIFLKNSTKNSSFFSRQALLIIFGSIIPLLINLLGVVGVINISIYLTPISFAIGIIFYFIALFRFNFLSVTPIALQKIVDRMSDSYLVVNEDGIISDFNQTFLKTFSVKDSDLRKKSLESIFLHFGNQDFINKINTAISQAMNNSSTEKIEHHFTKNDKYFNIEITSIFSKKTFLGTLILFKDITQHTVDMQTIKSNQDTLIEQERLASLGQMIGGIAHNLKTPIMSISGAAEGLSDLTKEYNQSIEDPEVTPFDHHQIAHDMNEWIEKIRTHLSYMSDVITAVKGQAVAFSDNSKNSFTAKELVKHIDILMRHELKNAIVSLNTQVLVDDSIEFNGNINSLVQVVNNIISNAIQAYNGKPNENINLLIYQESKKLIIKIEDFAGGLPEKVKEKLFKEMITTKGKNGTGLGLFMSYSNIKAHFNGNMRYETENGKGTTFYIEIPI